MSGIEIVNTGTGIANASVTVQEAQTPGAGRAIALVTSRAMVVVVPALLASRRVRVGALVVEEGEIDPAQIALGEEVPATRWMLIQTLMMRMKRQRWPA